MKKIILAAIVALLVYGCARSQLSRSGIEGYDNRAQVERKHLFRPETLRRIERASDDMHDAAQMAKEHSK